MYTAKRTLAYSTRGRELPCSISAGNVCIGGLKMLPLCMCLQVTAKIHKYRLWGYRSVLVMTQTYRESENNDDQLYEDVPLHNNPTG